MVNQVKNVKIFKLQNSLKNLSLNLDCIQNICAFGPYSIRSEDIDLQSFRRHLKMLIFKFC